MLREAATGPVIGGQKGYAGDYGPAIEAWLDTPGGSPSRRTATCISPTRTTTSSAGSTRATTSSSRSPATTTSAPDSRATSAAATEAQLDTPDGVAIAPDGDLSSPTRTTTASAASIGQTGVITTIAGSGDSGYRRRRPAGDRGRAEHPERGRRRAERRHLHRRYAELPRPDDRSREPGLSTRSPATAQPARRTTSATAARPPSAPLNMPSDVADRAATATSTSPTCTTSACARSTRAPASSRPSPAAATGATPATTGRPPRRALAGPAGIAVVPDADGKVTHLHRRLLQRPRPRRRARRHHPRCQRRRARWRSGAPTRVAYAPTRGWLYVADSSQRPDRAADHPADRAQPRARAAGPVAPATRRVGG